MVINTRAEIRKARFVVLEHDRRRGQDAAVRYFSLIVGPVSQSWPMRISSRVMPRLRRGLRLEGLRCSFDLLVSLRVLHDHMVQSNYWRSGGRGFHPYRGHTLDGFQSSRPHSALRRTASWQHPSFSSAQANVHGLFDLGSALHLSGIHPPDRFVSYR